MEFIEFLVTILQRKCKVFIVAIRFQLIIIFEIVKNKCSLFDNKINFYSFPNKLLCTCINVSPIDETWNFILI